VAHGDIQSPNPGQKVARQYRIQGGVNLFLETGLRPVVIVDDLSGGGVADRGFPRNAAGARTEPAGGVGTNAQCMVHNVAGKGIIAHVTQALVVSTAAPDTVQLRVGNATSGDLGLTIVVARYRDVRVVTPTNAIVGGNTPLTAAIDGVLVQTWRNVNGTTDSVLLPMDFILGDDDFVNINNGATNAGLQVSYWWTEYLLDES